VQHDDYNENFSNVNNITGVVDVIQSLEGFNPKSYGLPNY
jgi:hypothetical protein